MKKLIFGSVMIALVACSAGCKTTGGMSPEVQSGVRIVYDTIIQDDEMFAKYCAQNQGGMRKLITGVIVDLAKQGKISGNYEKIGTTVGPRLGEKCPR